MPIRGAHDVTPAQCAGDGESAIAPARDHLLVELQIIAGVGQNDVWNAGGRLNLFGESSREIARDVHRSRKSLS